MRQKISSWVSQTVSWSKSEMLLVKGIISQDVIWDPQTFLSSGFLHPPLGQPYSLSESMQLTRQNGFPFPCNFSAGETGWLESGPAEDQRWYKVDSNVCGGGEEWDGTKGCQIASVTTCNLILAGLYLVHWPGLLLLCRHRGECANSQDGNSLDGRLSCRRKLNVILQPQSRLINLSLDRIALRRGSAFLPPTS